MATPRSIFTPPTEPALFRQRTNAAIGAALRRAQHAATALGWNLGYTFFGPGNHSAMAAAVTGQPSITAEGESDLEALSALSAKLEQLHAAEVEADVAGQR